MVELDEEWENFDMNNDFVDDNYTDITFNKGNDIIYEDNIKQFNKDKDKDNISNKKIKILDAPKCTPIYISTKTKIAYLNKSININDVFWKIPIIDYYCQKEGIIKKQMKITTFTKEDTENIERKLKTVKNYRQNIITHIDNPKSKSLVKYKHVQKINIGLCKKDIISYRSKEKGAFYNCFAIIVRLKYNNKFKEVHIKVFNTGKLEIPGIQNNDLLYMALDYLVSILKNIIDIVPDYVNCKELYYDKDNIETVLINSNFNCGYYINREVLHKKLKYEYGLISMYDPCSYPGIQSKFYYNKNKEIQDGICSCYPNNTNNDINMKNSSNDKCSKKGTGIGQGNCSEISFMIFRTGSILIVGHCDEDVLAYIYDFLKNILESCYNEINDGILINKKEKKIIKTKTKKIRIDL
jgi:hypothetical protein